MFPCRSHETQSDLDLGHFQTRWILWALRCVRRACVTRCPAGGLVSSGCVSAIEGGGALTCQDFVLLCLNLFKLCMFLAASCGWLRSLVSLVHPIGPPNVGVIYLFQSHPLSSKKLWTGLPFAVGYILAFYSHRGSWSSSTVCCVALLRLYINPEWTRKRMHAKQMILHQRSNESWKLYSKQCHNTTTL